MSAITEVTVAAFETLEISNHTEQFIIEALRIAVALTVSLVAEVNGSVVGHIAFSPLTSSDGTRLSASAFTQYNTDDAFITNFRLRYNPKKGNDFYIVFNEGRTACNSNVTPDLPNFNSRTVMLKYSQKNWSRDKLPAP